MADYVYPLGCLIILLASFVQGLTSFGFALLAVPLLSLLLPLDIVVPISVMLSLLTNVFILCDAKDHVAIRKIWILILFGILAIPCGVYLLKVLNPLVLKMAVGAVVLVTALAMLRGYRFHLKNERLSFAWVGALSGLLNGSISFSGPPIVLFLSNQGVGKNEFRANLTAYAIITNIFAIATLAISGVLKPQSLQLSGLFFPCLVVGVLAGIKAAGRVDEVSFRKATLYLISAMGVWTMVTTAQTLL